ncbi:MAG: flagellin [Oscillospiraceae bacterium]|nr:flagellin [Oscillospiraceae bacterium]
MPIRMTSSMISGEYKNQMNTTLSQLDYYTKRAQNLRNFSKFSENPLGASKAMRLRRSYTQNQDYMNNIENVGKTYTMAEESAMNVKNILDEAKDILTTSSNFGTRSQADYMTFATALRGFQQDILQSMNAKVNDTYVFGGANATEIPFKLDGGNLQFRGVEVATGDAGELESLSKESIYIDIGLGINVDKNGNVDTASVFNDTMNGLEFFGYGEDDDGYSKNVYNLLGQAADAIEKYAKGNGTAYNKDIASKFIEKVSNATSRVLISTSNLGIKQNQLDSLGERLVSTQEELTEQLHNLEYVDAEEAYTDYTWQQYVYNASLQIGSKLLQTSFLDFMK